MISRSIDVVGVSLVLLSLAAGLGQRQVAAEGDLLGLGGVVNGLTSGLTGGLSGALDGLGQTSPSVAASASAGPAAAAGVIPNLMGGVTGTVGNVMKPVMGMLGSLSGGLMGQNGILGGALHSTLGGISGLTAGDSGMISNNLRLATGALGGIGTGLSAGLNGIERANGFGPSYSSNPALATGMGMRNNFKREAMAEPLIANNIATAATLGAMSNGGIMSNPAAAAAAAATAATTTTAAATELGAAAAAAPVIGSLVSPAAPGLDISGAAAAAAGGAAAAANTVAANSGLLGDTLPQPLGPFANQLGRQAIALDAMRNAQAESALAGAESAAHGNNNARSASMASNAYRQAKLATARDRVNIAGTIQNSARISDAAIATHDAATKAEDSLLGSELAVDSAATVLDSDAAYIPPVTNSLLRSLPYGRLGIRNIIPKPLTYPSPYLPDVWLNGKPVNYMNVPLKMYPYGFGPYGPYSTLNQAYGLYNGQPFIANNGIPLNEMVYDPAYAYMINSHMHAALGNSMVPILANGQLEAQDELAINNLLTTQQLNGAGMATTYHGFGRLNPVPMITGSVSEANLMPTTTIGTTYPIGSALVIEPRDSYFQDYNDNASSRQNMDERQQ